MATANDKNCRARKVSTSCTLDCWDACSIIADVDGNRIVSIAGNPDNHVTGVFLCSKGKKHIEMLNSPERLRKPMYRTAEGWTDIDWDMALDLVADKLQALRSRYPTTALLHCYDCGNGGLLKGIDRRFFNAFGGATVPKGSLCWGAGIAAQKYDFGDSLSHDPDDLQNSRTILIWSRNPADTGVHLIPFIQKAAKNGAYIVVIDPLETATVKYAHQHISPKPGTDGALALAMANVIISENLADDAYVAKHVIGFDRFSEYVKEFTPGMASGITGIPAEAIVSLARRYGTQKPSCILLGYGLQRYSNGGNTVRAIDALGAITGNIGIPGGGVNYANKRIGKYIDDSVIDGESLRKNFREYPRPRMASFIENAGDPPVKMVFTARANPATQAMDSNRLAKAFSKVDFKVTMDLFMTDTARLSDLVLPCRHFLEDEDIIYTSMGHSYINYCNRVVEPDPWVPSELWIFNELAGRLDLEGFPIQDERWWLERAILPLTRQKGITLDDLKNGPVQLPGISPVAWDSFEFKTPSGKIELYSERALADGHSPIPVFRNINPKPTGRYPYHFLTPHHRDSLHSQHFVLADGGARPVAYINPATATAEGIEDGSKALVSTEAGNLLCRVKVDKNIGEGIVMVYEGWWIQKSGGVNQLIPERETDMGTQAAYNDCMCNISRGRFS
ncbi:MAG: molybdopterin-dependent oxidoreductase [Bacillota bacterium]|nr:molybdopterin-dependent oxidoreductase [Bacillota bacterium]